MFPPISSAVQPCGLDKLRLYVPREERLNPDFGKLRREVQARTRFQTSEDYRPFGFPFTITPPDWKRGRKAPLNLDFIPVGKMSADDILGALTRVLTSDPMDLRVGHVDFTADWIGGTINLCRNSLNVKFKRKLKEYVNRNNKVMCSEAGAVETIYFGSTHSEDFFRVYDKAAELRVSAPETDAPASWVRIEHHLRGRCLPIEIRTLRGVLENGASCEPFSRVVMLPRPRCDVARLLDWKATPNQRRNVMYTQQLLDHFGEGGARKILREEGRKPDHELAMLDRALKELAIPIPASADFNKLFQVAFKQQMWPCSGANIADLYNNSVCVGNSPSLLISSQGSQGIVLTS